MQAPAKLKAWREEKDLSQGQAAELAEISQASWSDYESGRKKPGIEQAIRISDLTGRSRHHVAVEDWRETKEERQMRRELKRVRRAANN